MKPSYLKSSLYTFAITAILLCSSQNHAQQYYKWMDANGSTHYTTTPPPKGAKRLDKVSTYGSSHQVKQNPSQQDNATTSPNTAPQVPQVEPEVPANTVKPQTPPANTPQSVH